MTPTPVPPPSLPPFRRVLSLLSLPPAFFATIPHGIPGILPAVAM